MKNYLFLIALLLAPTVHAAPKDGQLFKDWIQRCMPLEDQQQCHIEQNIVTGKEKKQRLLTVQIGLFEQRKIATFIPPLGVLLQQGIGIEIDNFKFSNRAPFTFCNSAGCFASLELDEKMISLLKKGRILTVKIVNPNGKEIPIPVSLKGFTPAFESLSSD
jgi:invasion protein IalB